VRLVNPNHPYNTEERTYTDNLSLHGACVISSHPWQPGAEAKVAPLKNGEPQRATAVYCKQFAIGRYHVGLAFRNPPVKWSIYSYPGVV
jgi:hypothetical protein